VVSKSAVADLEESDVRNPPKVGVLREVWNQNYRGLWDTSHVLVPGG